MSGCVGDFVYTWFLTNWPGKFSIFFDQINWVKQNQVGDKTLGRNLAKKLRRLSSGAKQ